MGTERFYAHGAQKAFKVVVYENKQIIIPFPGIDHWRFSLVVTKEGIYLKIFCGNMSDFVLLNRSISRKAKLEVKKKPLNTIG